MTEQDVKQLVLGIIHDIAPDDDLSAVDPAVRLRDQLDLDSMDFPDIVMELWKRHQIEVPETEYMKLSTLDGCVEYLGPRLSAKAVP